MSTRPAAGSGRGLTPWGPVELRPAEGATASRILDAAWDCFVEAGIAATTMEQIARRAGMSRVWLYRHFPNRDAIVRALIAREVARFLDGMTAQLDPAAPGGQLVADAFVYAIGFLQGHELLNRLLGTEPEVLLPFITVQGGPVLAAATEMVAPLLARRLGRDEADAVLVAEALVRLVASCVLTPRVVADLGDEAEARRLVAALVPARPGPRAPRG